MATGGGNSGGATASAIRAGGAFVELLAKDRLSPVLAKVQSRMAGFGAAMSKIGGSAIKAGALTAAPLAALLAGAIGHAKEGVFGAKAQSDATRFTNAWERALISLQAAMLPVLELIVPILENLSAMARANAPIVQIVAALAVGMIAFGVAAKVLAAGLAVASAGIAVVKIAVLALASPFLLLAGALVGLAAAGANWGELFGKLGATGKDAIGGIVGAFKSGQLELAGRIALAGLKLAWHDLIEWMKAQLDRLRGAVGGADQNNMLGGILGGAGGLKLMSMLAKGSKFMRFGGPVGLAAGIGVGMFAEEQLKKQLGGNALDMVRGMMRGGQNGQGVDRERERLSKELADLIASVNKTVEMPGGRQWPIEATKGLFTSPDFKRAMGYGDTVAQKTLAVQEMQLQQQQQINQNLQNMPILRIE